MASESTKDPILELMFEELEPQERDALRAEIEGDPEQAAELESFELLMGRVREADLVEEVPESVHASIMQAARSGAARGGTGPRVSRRGPSDSESIWSKFAGGGAGQIALVATVLVAAAFVYQVVGPMSGPQHFGDSAEAPLSEMQSNERSTAVVEDGFGADEDFVPEEAEPSADGEALARLEGEDKDLFGTPKTSERALDTNAVPEEETLLGGMQDKMEESKELARVDQPVPTPRRSRSKARPSSARELSAAAESRGSGNTASGVTSKQDVERKGADYLSIDDLEDSNEPASAAPAAPADEMPQAEQQRAYEPPADSPAAIQQTYDSRDYNTTLREANDYLGGEAGTATDRATVMQLKAASLVALGRYAEADRVYQNIERAYPNFRPEQVSQARADISRRLEDRKAPKRKAKPSPKKSDYDFDDRMLESEEMPSAY